jgi:hypothetical protein
MDLTDMMESMGVMGWLVQRVPKELQARKELPARLEPGESQVQLDPKGYQVLQAPKELPE